MICSKCGLNEAEFCRDCYSLDRLIKNAKFKKAVWRKAGNKCEECGESCAKILTVHHLDKQAFPYDASKAVLLCLNCHAKKDNHTTGIMPAGKMCNTDCKDTIVDDSKNS